MDGYKLLRRALDDLAMDVYKEIIRRLHSSAGINPRTGTNTLVDSDLERSIDVYTNSECDGLVFEIAEYYKHIVSGWAHTGRYPGTKMDFLNNLLKWVQKKNIRFGNNHTDNQTAYLVYKSINERLIAPRPFIGFSPEDDLDVILPFLKGYFDKFADDVFNMIVEEIDKSF